MNRNTINILIMVSLLIGLNRVTASAAAPTRRVEVSVQDTVEDNEHLLIATVTNSGHPLEGVTVRFFVKRTFGNLLLGEDQTLDDGTAAVDFPKVLPGDHTGRLNVITEAVTPSGEVMGRGQSAVKADTVITTTRTDPFPRALWARHAPLPLLLTVIVIFGGVWLTYAFVVVQIIKLKAKG